MTHIAVDVSSKIAPRQKKALVILSSGEAGAKDRTSAEAALQWT